MTKFSNAVYPEYHSVISFTVYAFDRVNVASLRCTDISLFRESRARGRLREAPNTVIRRGKFRILRTLLHRSAVSSSLVQTLKYPSIPGFGTVA